MILYKYCHYERVEVLNRCLIRYTQPAAFNDPFETKPFISQICHPHEFEKIIDDILPEETNRLYDQLPELAKKVFSLEFVEMHVKKQLPDTRQMMSEFEDLLMSMLRDVMNRKLNELMGVLSLTEKPDNLLMWSHYANSHEGYVIGFDSSNKYFDERKGPNDEIRHLRKVEYRDQRPQLPLTGLTGVEILLVKSSHWHYEHEWRIIRPLADAETIIPVDPYPIHLFRFPPDIVKEVILGCGMPKDHKAVILDILENSGCFDSVRVFDALPDEAEFKIIFREHKI